MNPSTRVWALAALVVALEGGVGSSTAAGQIISPGDLSVVHADLEGMRNCTRCHQLRKAGASRSLCLNCHDPLARRLAEAKGFHASLAEDDCAACHKEHFGSEFPLIRLDTLAFDHTRTGYALEGRHAEVTCRSCHRGDLIADPEVSAYAGKHRTSDRTFLGLPTDCATCHQSDSPHGDQFGSSACTECHDTGGWKGAEGFDHRTVRARLCTACHQSDSPHGDQFGSRTCTECHDTESWKGAKGFDHRTARFRLVGAHRVVACGECHVQRTTGSGAERVRYRPIPYQHCSDCHRDQHGGAMGSTCEDCHSTTAWTNLDRDAFEDGFDHASTGFTLVGRHAALECASCHDAETASGLLGIALRFHGAGEDRSFPPPVADSCGSCHVDRHSGVFTDAPSGTDCAACHGQMAWLPVDYDADRHNVEADFELDSTHRVIPCGSCHESVDGMPRFRLGNPTCSECHAASDPHAGQFEGESCETCHGPSSFRIADFDHSRARYRLEGAHLDVPCAGCHLRTVDAAGREFVRYRPIGTDCRDCHGDVP